MKHFWKYAYLEPVLNADETTLRVLKIQGKPVKKLGQMWVVCTGASAKLLIAIYTYRGSRSKVTAEKLLGSYDGIVQTDGFQSYGSGDYLHAGCWSHARRKFLDSIPENDKNSKAEKLSRSSTEHLLWSVKQEKQTSRRKRYWRCGRKR